MGKSQAQRPKRGKRHTQRLFNFLVEGLVPAHPKKKANWLYLYKAIRYKLQLPVRVHGIWVKVHKVDSETIVGRLLAGMYEASESRSLRTLIGPKDRILEVGTGLGVIGCMAAQLANAGEVLSFEANPKLVELARETIRANKVKNIHVRSGILAEEAGSASFYVAPNFWASSTTPHPEWPQIQVETHPILDVLNAFPPTCLVMDIEGGEYELLPLPALAQCETLQKLVVEFHPLPDAAAKLSNLWLFDAAVWSCSWPKEALFDRLSNFNATVVFQRMEAQ